jgi:hypothetical protein
MKQTPVKDKAGENVISPKLAMVDLTVAVTKSGPLPRTEEVWFPEPVERTVYQRDYRPVTTDEKKKIFGGTLANLKAEMDSFLAIGDMLGPYKDTVAGAVAQVKKILANADANMDSEKIAEELRKGTFLRAQMKQVLGKVAVEVESRVEAAIPKRRILKKSAVGQG